MTLIYFLIVLGILVFVHEFGHFIMAKMAGVRVEKFSLGMGPKLIGYKKGDTEYLISALPLGGYVKMAGENPDEEPTGAADEFQSKTVWQRVKIAATGPLTNIVLAFIVMPLVFMVGTYVEGPVRVGFVVQGSPAEHAGFLPGDVIETINGKTIDEWAIALTMIALNPDKDVAATVLRRGEKKILKFRPPQSVQVDIENYGLVADMPAVIGGIVKGLPAEKEGIQPKDKVIAVNGKPILYWSEFTKFVRESGGGKIRLSIEHNQKRMEKVITPIESSGKFVIGVEPSIQLEFKRYGFIDSIKRGYTKTLQLVDITFIGLKRLLTFSLSIKTMGGPIRIAQLSGQAAQLGLSNFLKFLALISISLGILNLLPIPVLDGGLILFLVIEAIRKKPLSRRTMEIAQGIGAAVLITLIAVVSYNDIVRAFFTK